MGRCPSNYVMAVTYFRLWWKECLCQTVKIPQTELNAGVGHIHFMKAGRVALWADITLPSKWWNCDGVLRFIVRQVVTDSSIHVALWKMDRNKKSQRLKISNEQISHAGIKNHLRLQQNSLSLCSKAKHPLSSNAICYLKTIPTHHSTDSLETFYL